MHLPWYKLSRSNSYDVKHSPQSPLLGLPVVRHPPVASDACHKAPRSAPIPRFAERGCTHDASYQLDRFFPRTILSTTLTSSCGSHRGSPVAWGSFRRCVREKSYTNEDPCTVPLVASLFPKGGEGRPDDLVCFNKMAGIIIPTDSHRYHLPSHFASVPNALSSVLRAGCIPR